MDFDLLLKIVTPVLLIILGFMFNRKLHMFKTTADSTARFEEYVHQTKVEYLDKKLKAFLNPIITAIEFDNETWHRISTLSDSEEVYPEELSVYMEKEYILRNHIRAVELARENMHFIAPNSKLHEQLILYMRHVAVFRSIRELELPLNPKDIYEEFPPKLEKLVRQEYKRTLDEYNALMGANPG